MTSSHVCSAWKQQELDTLHLCTKQLETIADYVALHGSATTTFELVLETLTKRLRHMVDRCRGRTFGLSTLMRPIRRWSSVDSQGRKKHDMTCVCAIASRCINASVACTLCILHVAEKRCGASSLCGYDDNIRPNLSSAILRALSKV